MHETYSEGEFDYAFLHGATDGSYEFQHLPYPYPNDTCLDLPCEQYMAIPYGDEPVVYRTEPIFMLCLPIIRGCNSVSNVRMLLYRETDSMVCMTWDMADSSTTMWELSYGLEGTAPEDGIVISDIVTTNTNFSSCVLLHHIIPDTNYVVWVGSVCTYGHTDFGSDWVPCHVRYHASHSSGDDPDPGDDPVGIRSAEMADDAVVLHPNPARDRVYVSAHVPIVDVRIFNSLGRQVLVEKTHDESVLMDLTTLAPGTYMACITTTQGTLTKRLVIN